MADKVNLTVKTIERLEALKGKRLLVYDSRTRGLGIAVQPSGHRAFFWFRKVASYPTWRTIGAFPDTSVEQARGEAEKFNRDLAAWKNSGYKGPSPFERRREGTLQTALDDYCEKHLKASALRPERAIAGVRGQLDCYAASLKSRSLDSIRREHLRELHAAVGEKHGKVTANRLVQSLKAIFNFAVREGWSGENPARHIKPFHEGSRERFLQPSEAPGFFRALLTEKNADLRDFVLLAIFLGARRANLTGMRWDQLDVDRGIWTIPLTKNGKSHTVPLVDEAADILRKRKGRRKNDDPWVFPSAASKSGHVEDFKRAWGLFRKRAGVGDLRIHDLRRTLGSWAAGGGTSLPIIGKMLGHQSSGATAVYARLHLDPVREAVNLATGAMIAAAKLPKRAARKLLGTPRA